LLISTCIVAVLLLSTYQNYAHFLAQQRPKTMPPSQDEIRVVDADGQRNPVVMVNGKEVIVSSATEKPNRSFWVAWMYIFDVRLFGVNNRTAC
jgi:hypothetical protein